jgi:peptidoglycan L-alanyl-D-glutamate endopeptidase CwlK
MATLDARAARALEGVHPDLRRIVLRAAALSPVAFTVTEGMRTLERQRKLMAVGASQTLRSRHLTGHAVDLAAKVGGQIRWDWPLYDQLAVSMKRAAAEEQVPLDWGGDWKDFRDGPHYQLPWSHYP